MGYDYQAALLERPSNCRQERTFALSQQAVCRKTWFLTNKNKTTDFDTRSFLLKVVLILLCSSSEFGSICRREEPGRISHQVWQYSQTFQTGKTIRKYLSDMQTDRHVSKVVARGKTVFASATF